MAAAQPRRSVGADALASAFFDSHPHAVLIVDARGRVLRGNRAAAWLADGGRYPDFTEMTGIEVPHDAVAAKEHGPVWSRRLRVRAADGSSRQVDASLVVADPSAGQAGFLILADATPAVEAARSQQQSESRSRVTTESAPVLVWMAGPDMRCDWFNNSWLRFRGRTLGDEVGDGWTEGVHPEDLERCLGVHEASFEAREPFTLDYRLKRHDGRFRWMLATAVPRYGADDEFLGYIGTCLDITDRRELEDKLAEHTRVLRLSDRRREDFLGRLSHELRSPLAPIANVAGVLRHMEHGKPELARLRGIIERQVEHLQQLITDLVDVTRITKGKIVLQREEVDVRALIATALERVQHDADRRRQVFAAAKPFEAVTCLGDAHRLAQALSALLANAVKFSSEGATIEVDVETTAENVAIHVRDRGRGIAPDFLPRVFELYLQGEPQFTRDAGGLGVGLTIARRIALLHGGDVEVDSPGIGLGTQATLRLLRSDGAAASDGGAIGIETSDADDLRKIHDQRVLVIEDDDDARDSLRLLLELSGNEVRTAATSTEGLLIAERFMPQLVVCDIGLPDIDGYTLVQSLRDRLAGQPTRYVALTGFGRAEDRDRALDSGFDSFLVKPLPSAPIRQ